MIYFVHTTDFSAFLIFMTVCSQHPRSNAHSKVSFSVECLRKNCSIIYNDPQNVEMIFQFLQFSLAGEPL